MVAAVAEVELEKHRAIISFSGCPLGTPRLMAREISEYEVMAEIGGDK